MDLDEYIKENTDEVISLCQSVGALKGHLQIVLSEYVKLAASGDCGHWDPEKEDFVIAARKALIGEYF